MFKRYRLPKLSFGQKYESQAFGVPGVPRINQSSLGMHEQYLKLAFLLLQGREDHK